MDSQFWIIAMISVLILVLAFVAVYVRKKKKVPTDYYSLFVMGSIWLLFGVLLDYSLFLIMGLVFVIIGVTNKDKWKKNRRKWAKMGKDEKKLFVIAIVVLVALLVAGVAVFFLVQNGVS